VASVKIKTMKSAGMSAARFGGAVQEERRVCKAFSELRKESTSMRMRFANEGACWTLLMNVSKVV
jgi:hypothetical protein